MKLILLITSVVICLYLAGCGKDIETRPPWEMPDRIPPLTPGKYVRDISFDTLTIAGVQEVLRGEKKWMVEAKYISDIIDQHWASFYNPPGSEKYFEFTGRYSLRLVTDTGATTYNIAWESSTLLRLLDADSTVIRFEMPGISNYRLQLYELYYAYNEYKEYGRRFECIPEERLPGLPKPDLSQRDSFHMLSIHQIMQFLSGTKWKLWEVCGYGPCREPNVEAYYEFIGTNTLRITRDSVTSDHEIGRFFEERHREVLGVSKGFHSSSPYYRTLEEAGPSFSCAYLMSLYDKKMRIYFSPWGVTDLEVPTYNMVLVK
jgi:hypothetical protein